MHHLLLLHGAIGAKDQLEPLAVQLRNKFTVHTLNFRGHGGVAFTDKPFSIPNFENDVIDYLNQANIQQINIFGYSMGGYVAMYFAKNNHGRVNKIITLATKFYWDKAIAEKEMRLLNPETIVQKIPAFAKQLEQRHHPNDWKKILEKTKEMLLELGDQNTLQPEDYRLIKNQSLLLLGDKDKMITLDETLAVKQALPNAEFELLSNTSHPIEQVNAEMLSEKIQKFINQIL